MSSPVEAKALEQHGIVMEQLRNEAVAAVKAAGTGLAPEVRAQIFSNALQAATAVWQQVHQAAFNREMAELSRRPNIATPPAGMIMPG